MVDFGLNGRRMQQTLCSVLSKFHRNTESYSTGTARPRRLSVCPGIWPVARVVSLTALALAHPFYRAQITFLHTRARTNASTGEPVRWHRCVVVLMVSSVVLSAAFLVFWPNAHTVRRLCVLFGSSKWLQIISDYRHPWRVPTNRVLPGSRELPA